MAFYLPQGNHVVVYLPLEHVSLGPLMGILPLEMLKAVGLTHPSVYVVSYKGVPHMKRL